MVKTQKFNIDENIHRY